MWAKLKGGRLIISGIAMGIAIAYLIVTLGSESSKVYLAAAGAVVFGFLLICLREPEQLCICLFWLALPFPMHGFLLKLNPFHGGGALGIYLMAADLPLILLYGFWFFRPRSDRQQPLLRNKYILGLLPFLVWSALSMFYSPRPFWAFCEWIRWIKVGLIFIYAAYGMRPQYIRLSIRALAASTALQSTLAILQSLFKSTLGLEKLGIFGAAGEQAVRFDLVSGETVFRGSGLTGHPNFLAALLLIALPIYGLLPFAERSRSLKVIWFSTALLGLGGLFSTMSRAAWVALLISGSLAFILAAVYSLIPVRRFAVISLTVLSLAGILAASFSDLIMKRFQSDWSESWKLRRDLSRTAIDIASDHLIAGVGLNNYTVVYPQYDRAFADQMMDMDEMITAVHNSFLLVWAEIGTVGLATYLFFYIMVFTVTFSRLRALGLWGRALCLGVVCGILGAMAFDLSELGLWMDLSLYLIAFLVGMCSRLQDEQMKSRVFELRRPRQTRFEALAS